jgi:hypothetical protein
MDVENPLPASAVSVSMKIKGVCVMSARKITNALKRCCYQE